MTKRRKNPALPRAEAAVLEQDKRTIEAEEAARGQACAVAEARKAAARAARECRSAARRRASERVRARRGELRAQAPTKRGKRAAGRARLSPAQVRQRKQAAENREEQVAALIADAAGYVPEAERGAFERWAGRKVRLEPGWTRGRYELLAERWNEGAQRAELASFEDAGLDKLEREQWEAGALYQLGTELRPDLEDELGDILDDYSEDDADDLRRALEAAGMNVAKELGKMRAKETRRRANPASESDRLLSELRAAARRWSAEERAADPDFYDDPGQEGQEPDAYAIVEGEGRDGCGVTFGEEMELPLREVCGALEARPPSGEWARVRSVRDVEAMLWPATRRNNPAMVTKKTTKKKTTKKAAPVAAASKKRRKVRRSPKPAAKGKRRLPGQASVDAREFSALTASQRASILEVLRREGRGAPVVRSNPAPMKLERSAAQWREADRLVRLVRLERNDIVVTAKAVLRLRSSAQSGLGQTAQKLDVMWKAAEALNAADDLLADWIEANER